MKNVSNALRLAAFVAVTGFSAVYPGTTFAATPSWDGAVCTEQFVGEFVSVGNAKVYTTGGDSYMLLAAKKNVGGFDIYRSDLVGGLWAIPVKVDTLSTGSHDIEMIVIGLKVYIVRTSNVFVCDWDGSVGSLCHLQNYDVVNPSPISLNTIGDYMYYSGSGGVGGLDTWRFDMSVNPWHNEGMGIEVDGVDTYGVYLGDGFAIEAIKCNDMTTYDCEPLSSRFYTFAGDGSLIAPAFALVPGASEWTGSIHPDIFVGSPYVAEDGIFWFTSGPNSGNRHLYSCPPVCGDGYCLGSADCFADCCPAPSCEGQGCPGYDCGCEPDCAGKECGDDGCGGICGTCFAPETCVVDTCECEPTTCEEEGYECGTPDNGCGAPLACGDCPPGQACGLDYHCACEPDCVGKECGDDGCGESCGTCLAPETCVANTCGCVPDCAGKECGENGCGGSCGACTPPETCQEGGTCACVPTDCVTLGFTCGEASDGCGGTIPSCGSCDPGYACASNHCACADICGDGVCCGGEACGACSDCNHPYPNVQLISGCELEYCGSDPAVDPVIIKNNLGETCTFTMDVKHDGTPAAQITMVDEGGIQSILECDTAGCSLVYGNVDIDDNGQHITASPSGEDVTTGIVGTHYSVRRYTDEHDIFEARCSEGHVWYTFNDFSPIYTVHLGDCAECAEEATVDLTTDEPIIPDTPDGGDDDGGIDGGDDDGGSTGDDGGGEVIDDGGGEVIDDDGGPDDDGGTGDGTIDGNGETGGGGGGGCQCSAGHSGNEGLPSALLMIILAAVLAYARRVSRTPVKVRSKK